MTVNVLVAFSRMSSRDFKEYQIGMKYHNRIKEVAEEIVADYFREVYDNNFDINFSENTYTTEYKKNQDALVDVVTNINMMNNKRFDLVIFLDDHPLRPDPIISVEMNLCNMLQIPCALIDFDQIVADVKASENAKRPVLKPPITLRE